MGIRERDHGPSDIAARTELSYARQALSAVGEMLYGHGGEVGEMRERVLLTEKRIDDLLHHINVVLGNNREVHVNTY